jgi:hypothetical protein
LLISRISFAGRLHDNPPSQRHAPADFSIRAPWPNSASSSETRRSAGEQFAVFAFSFPWPLANLSRFFFSAEMRKRLHIATFPFASASAAFTFLVGMSAISP